MGPYVYADRYHEQVIRSKLTSNFSGLFDDIKDEIAQAFSDNIVLEGSGMVQAHSRLHITIDDQIAIRLESHTGIKDDDPSRLQNE